MIENIIYYSMCIFFSLLGLGGSWYSVHKHFLPKVLGLLMVSLFVAYLAFSQPELIAFLDITYSLSWLGETIGQGSRLKMAAITAVFFATVGYLVCLEHVAVAGIKRITNKGSRTR